MPEIKDKQKIILVDDDDFMINMYTTKFNNKGFIVESCKSGDDLLSKLNAGLKADLILMDVIMPKITGLEILDKMRQNKIGEDIPVIMLTNQSEEKDINEAKRLKAAGYLIKSAMTPSEVVEKVMKIIKPN